MIYKKLYGSVLILGASFVATSSTSYSMVANMRQNRNQVRYMSQTSSSDYNYFNNSSCLRKPDLLQEMELCQVNLTADDCSARFANALGEFRSTMNQSLNVGGISLSNFSAVISAQTKLIDAMSDVISLLLRAQERQSTKSNEVKNILIMLENVFSPQGTQSGWQNSFKKKNDFDIIKQTFNKLHDTKKYKDTFQNVKLIGDISEYNRPEELLNDIRSNYDTAKSAGITFDEERLNKLREVEDALESLGQEYK